MGAAIDLGMYRYLLDFPALKSEKRLFFYVFFCDALFAYRLFLSIFEDN
ncbi:hypothetical protein LJD22_18565 [Bacillus velezensis]|nr:hypothetical protein [Bacillus velezensis]